MRPPGPMTARLTRSVALLAALAAGPAALGQGFDDVVDDEPEVGNIVQMHMFVYTDENFDQWVFGNGKSADTVRTSFDSLLAMQIEELDRACRLSDAQKKKLRLAGAGDVKRLFDTYAEKKRKFQLVKADQTRINEVLQDIQPLQASLAAGAFGEGSIFAKTLGRTLDPAQSERYAGIAREKQLYRYRARVELAVSILDNYVGMTADQRHRLADVLVAETRSPRKFGRYDYQVVVYQASKLPDTKLRPIFDDDQWRKVRRQFDQVKGMESYLRTNGFLPGDEKDGAVTIEKPIPRLPAPPGERRR
jgi:hypothetical protein